MTVILCYGRPIYGHREACAIPLYALKTLTLLSHMEQLTTLLVRHTARW